MKMKLTILTLFIVLSGFGCKQEKKYLSFTEVQAIYEEGLSFAAERAKVEPTTFRTFLTLVDFKQKSVGWAKVEGEKILAVEKSKNPIGWTIMYAPEDPYTLDPAQPVLKMSLGNVPGIHIKPFALSKEWAALFYTHELSHLYDGLTGRESSHPDQNAYLDGEVRAYNAEMEVAQLLSQGAYQKILGRYYQQTGEPTLAQLYTKITAPGGLGKLVPMMEELDTTVAKTTALNEDEDALRKGFHLMALALYTVQHDTHVPEKVRYAHYRAAVMNIMNVGKQGGFVPQK